MERKKTRGLWMVTVQDGKVRNQTTQPNLPPKAPKDRAETKILISTKKGE